MNKMKKLNSRSLQMVALALMLIDHTGHMFGKMIDPTVFYVARCIGRLAFPIFAFQIAEGCVHTSNWKKYAIRIFLFGLISELPFNMLHTGAWLLDPEHQNVMFTLLLGLLSLRVMLWANKKSLLCKLSGMLAFAAAFVLADMLKLDYGGMGVTMVVVFGLSQNMKYRIAVQTLCVFLLNYAQVMMHGSFDAPMRLLAVFAMIPIAMYNGKPGARNKLLQYGAYAFYPMHMALLVVLRYAIVKFF